MTCIPAFDASPETFLEFYRRWKAEIPNLVVYDHLITYSIYFADPIGTKLEIQCAQYDTMSAMLENSGIEPKRMNPSHDPDYRKI